MVIVYFVVTEKH